MVVVAIIGLVLSVTLTGSRSLLPQTRLSGSASALADGLELARSHALLRQEPVVFAYDLDGDAWEAFHPFVRDERGTPAGPGRTPVIDSHPLETGIAFRRVRLPGGVPREDGVVALEISPLGRVSPHEVVLENPEYPDSEVLTVRVSGLANRSLVLEGDVVMAPLQDVDFR